MPIEPIIPTATLPADYGNGYGYPVSAPASHSVIGPIRTSPSPASPSRSREATVSSLRERATKLAADRYRRIPDAVANFDPPMRPNYTPGMLAADRRAAEGATTLHSRHQKPARLPNPMRTTARRGALRSSVTVIRVDPATLRASRARTRNGNVSERVLDAGTVVARNVKSRQTLRKLAANV